MAKHFFDLKRDTVERSLKRFSEQSGQQVIILSSLAAGVLTNPVKGEFTARVALERLLAGTGLTVAEDEKTGAFAVKKSAAPSALSPTGGARPETSAARARE